MQVIETGWWEGLETRLHKTIVLHFAPTGPLLSSEVYSCRTLARMVYSSGMIKYMSA